MQGVSEFRHSTVSFPWPTYACGLLASENLSSTWLRTVPHRPRTRSTSRTPIRVRAVIAYIISCSTTATTTSTLLGVKTHSSDFFMRLAARMAGGTNCVVHLATRTVHTSDDAHNCIVGQVCHLLKWFIRLRPSVRRRMRVRYRG